MYNVGSWEDTGVNALTALMQAHTTYGQDKQLQKWGQSMFDMYSSGGFPPDMFLEQLELLMSLTLSQKVYIVSEYQRHMLAHKRLAGIADKKLKHIRKTNCDVIERLIRTGEAGVY